MLRRLLRLQQLLLLLPGCIGVRRRTRRLQQCLQLMHQVYGSGALGGLRMPTAVGQVAAERVGNVWWQLGARGDARRASTVDGIRYKKRLRTLRSPSGDMAQQRLTPPILLLP